MTALETSPLNRRLFLQSTAAGLAATVLSQGAPRAVAATPYALPKLPYAFDALEPFIDAKTMEIHYGKHHQTYIDKLNAALAAEPALAAQRPVALLEKLDSIPEGVRTAVRNHGGGHVNHTFFWSIMGPGKGGEPRGKTLQMIDAQLGGIAKFREAFAAAAAGQFGSGWAWLVVEGDQLKVLSTPNQDSPISAGQRPILGIDVWEHAYYLKYQNRRPDYVTAWWNVVDWDAVEENLRAALG